MDYDFQTLSPDDFEKLIADLFSAEWGTILESYKPGKDSGIDLLHSRKIENHDNAILQCKRYPSLGFLQLLNSFKKELPKIAKLKPKKYIIATSCALSKANKEKLIKTLSPWITNTSDVYGQSEINTLLRKHKEIIRSHFKLWISSSATLEAILHAKIFNITSVTLDDIKTEMSKIVLHDGYGRALETLKAKHHCIIAGNPGIGKTTLAKVLLCHYAHEGFEPIIVHNDIADAWAVVSKNQIDNGKKIAILYDDFLGKTRFDQLKFGKNEDQLLISLIRLTEKTNNIRFILTSREYIIADARLAHGCFDDHADTITKCTINLTDYSTNHRARVLFNHLYFSNLPQEKIEAFVKSKLYNTIINHRNFNPRIIAAISNRANSDSLDESSFIDFVNTKFSNPAEIWEAPFKNEIRPLSRWILVTLWSLEGSSEVSRLKQAILALENFAFEAEKTLEFNNCLKELSENFITSEAYDFNKLVAEKITMIQFQNPSIIDFIESFLLLDLSWISTISEHSVFFAQSRQILSILQSKPSHPRTPEIAQQLLLISPKLTPKGSTYRNHSGQLVFTDTDLLSNNDQTLTLLKLRALLPETSEEHSFLTSITTYEGWSKQFDNLAIKGSEPYSICRLVRWLVKSELWNTHYISIKSSFHAAFTACINTQIDWCSELSTLNLLHDCVHMMGIQLSPIHKLKIQIDANESASNILRAEEDIQRLEEAADHLEQFHKRIKFGNRQVVLDLREKAEKNYTEDQTSEEIIDESNLNEKTEDLDIDLIFSELLHR
jgi:DNA polymerase III delta prime subunit